LNITPKKEEGFYGYELATRWTIIVFLRLLLILLPHDLGLRFMMRHPLYFPVDKAHNQGDISKMEGQTLLPPPHIRPFNFENASL
jgi:hypothetical protein